MPSPPEKTQRVKGGASEEARIFLGNLSGGIRGSSRKIVRIQTSAERDPEVRVSQVVRVERGSWKVSAREAGEKMLFRERKRGLEIK